MAFEPGNKLGQKGKVFDAALRRAISQDDGRKLRAAAEKLLNLAADGEAWAIKELADRLDGRSVQVQDVTITKTIMELTDNELIDIATGGGEGDIAETASETPPPSLH